MSMLSLGWTRRADGFREIVQAKEAQICTTCNQTIRRGQPFVLKEPPYYNQIQRWLGHAPNIVPICSTCFAPNGLLLHERINLKTRLLSGDIVISPMTSTRLRIDWDRRISKLEMEYGLRPEAEPPSSPKEYNYTQDDLVGWTLERPLAAKR